MSRVAWILLLSAALAQPAYAQSAGPCGGFVTHLWVPQPGGGTINIGGGGSYGGNGNGGGGTHGATAVGGGGGSSGGGGGGGTHEATAVGGGGGSSSGGGGGGGDGAAILVLVVVAAAALPIVVWAIDEDAQPDVMQCWATPEERVSLYGGAASEAFGPAPFLGTRGLLHWYAMGLEGGVEGTRYGSFDVHGSVMARIPPKQHVELAVGFGGRHIAATFGTQSWFEVSLPQRYTPFRWNALEPGVSFDVRPAFLWNPGGAIDVRLDAAIVFPLGPWASIDLGGRAYSFQGKVQGGGMLGLQLSL